MTPQTLTALVAFALYGFILGRLRGVPGVNAFRVCVAGHALLEAACWPIAWLAPEHYRAAYYCAGLAEGALQLAVVFAVYDRLRCDGDFGRWAMRAAKAVWAALVFWSGGVSWAEASAWVLQAQTLALGVCLWHVAVDGARPGRLNGGILYALGLGAAMRSDLYAGRLAGEYLRWAEWIQTADLAPWLIAAAAVRAASGSPARWGMAVEAGRRVRVWAARLAGRSRLPLRWRRQGRLFE